jgi:sulfate transport system ATP-binding protein
MTISIRNITKQFGDFSALDNISLEVADGELVALLGPSGSGKTSLLRIVAGLETPDRGTVHFDGEEATRRSAAERQVGFVFQHYALFRHLNVFENVAFGLRVKPGKERLPEERIKSKVRELLALVQMDWMANRFPHQLSGGQRQRIALARALAVEPKVLLLDEPFGALDAKVRKELRRWLRRLHDEVELTSIFVTHDQEEALEVADRVVIMNEGRIEQAGTPEEVYDLPQNRFVYEFLGDVNLFRGRSAQTALNFITGPQPEKACGDTGAMIGYVRPHELSIDRTRPAQGSIEAEITRIRAIGPVVKIDLQQVENREFWEVQITRERFDQLKFRKGERVYIRVKNARFF